MENVRRAVVAGSFYPGHPQQLKQLVNDYLQSESPEAITPKAIISPHAGYIYSGAIAGKVFSLLRNQAPSIKRVILLGPPHRTMVLGIALSSAQYFETPLGKIPIDGETYQKLLALPTTLISDEAHQLEHSLEVQLPFIQEVFPNIPIVPLLAANISPEGICSALETIVDSQTIIIVSSDLSHYHEYHKAQILDQQATDAIVTLSIEKLSDHHACGATPIKGLLWYARKHGLTPQTVYVANSGDTRGSKDKVVGYGAYVFT